MPYCLTLIPIKPQSFRSKVPISTPRLTMPSGDNRVIGQIFNLSFKCATEPDVPESPKVQSQELPIGVTVERLYKDRIISTSTTKQGFPYRITTIGELKKITLPHDCDVYHKAAKAYLDTLPDDWQCVIELN